MTLFALQVASAIVGKVLEGTALGTAAGLVLGVLGVFLGVGATIISLKLVRGESAHYREMLPDWRLVWKFFIAGCIAGLIIMLPIILAAGFVFFKLVSVFGFEGLYFIGRMASMAGSGEELRMLLMPVWSQVGWLDHGLMIVATAVSTYLATRFSMVRFAVLDGAAILKSLQVSSKLTHGVKWRLIGFGLAVGVLNLIGLIPFGLGLLVTVPISMIAYAYVYNQLAR